MTLLLNGLHRLILWLCAALTVAIIGALAVQIVSRYVFNAPVHMTDDIAELSMVWLTFLGAALVYREGGHVGMDVLSGFESVAIKRVIHVLLHGAVIAVMLYILTQIQQIQPLMSRLEFGTVPKGPLTSKFMLIQFPFALGAGFTILFAAEAIWKELNGTSTHPTKEVLE